jgi:hypothetical protein
MNEELFAALMRSMGEALDHARGKRELRTTVLRDAVRHPPRILGVPPYTPTTPDPARLTLGEP